MAELDPQPVEPIEPVETPETTVVEPVEVRPSNRPRKIYSGLWGPAEIIVVAAGALALIAGIGGLPFCGCAVEPRACAQQV
jgi:hypothetical protein